MRQWTKTVVAGFLSVTLAAMPSAPAIASPLGDSPLDDSGVRRRHEHPPPKPGPPCEERNFYRVHSLAPRNFFVPRTRFIDGPGGEMTVSVSREHEVLAFTEQEHERFRTLTDKGLIRQVRRLVVPHLELRHMVVTGHEYTRKITKGKYGNMWYRVFGYRVGWSSWSEYSNCRLVKITSGISNVPANVEGWRYWETDHPAYKGRKLSLK